jgi:hypothetical protein
MPMPAYTPVFRIAERLDVTLEKLWDFQAFGWISIVEKDGTLFIPGHQEYKALLILRLQGLLKLNLRQISDILLAEEPPYSLQDVDRILAKTQAANPGAEAESFHEPAD